MRSESMGGKTQFPKLVLVRNFIKRVNKPSEWPFLDLLNAVDDAFKVGIRDQTAISRWDRTRPPKYQSPLVEEFDGVEIHSGINFCSYSLNF